MTERHAPLDQQLAAVWVDLLRDVGRASERAAERIAAVLDYDVEDLPATVRSRWGRKALRLEGLGTEQGMTTTEISAAVGLNDPPNTDKVLVQLEKDGRLELVPDSAPKHWRLSRDQRRNRILRASRLIPEGHWTSYGDIAVAVSGEIRAARAVSRVAAKNPAFANPHRVLEKAGTIPPGWKSDEGLGPEECERRLAVEGITLEDGRAPRELRILHDELQAKLAESEEAEAVA
jgi:alkylated DNA nucleotide flippase Atl1